MWMCSGVHMRIQALSDEDMVRFPSGLVERTLAATGRRCALGDR